MSRRATPKLVKRIIVPTIGPLLRIAHFKIFGRQVFINKYTKRIPLYSKILKLVELRVGAARVREERQQDYEKWFKRNYPSNNELIAQTRASSQFKQRPLISILTPTYNTNIKHLRECIESVINQT